MKVSDIFFKLMEAAQERGIEQCTGSLYRDSRGFGIDLSEKVVAVCTIGLFHWGRWNQILTRDEIYAISVSMPESIVYHNDAERWTWADFYEYLKDKEAAAEQKTVEQVTAPV